MIVSEKKHLKRGKPENTWKGKTLQGYVTATMSGVSVKSQLKLEVKPCPERADEEKALPDADCLEVKCVEDMWHSLRGSFAGNNGCANDACPGIVGVANDMLRETGMKAQKMGNMTLYWNEELAKPIVAGIKRKRDEEKSQVKEDPETEVIDQPAIKQGPDV